MATIATEVSTYADVAKRVDPNGGISGIVEILNRTNPILTDMLVKEANDGTGHRTTVRTGRSIRHHRPAGSGHWPG